MRTLASFATPQSKAALRIVRSAARARGDTTHGRRRGFTLVELLVVITIIGVLVAMMLPAIRTARETAQSAVCGTNLRQIAIGWNSLLADNRNWSPPAGEVFMNWNGVSMAGPTWSFHDFVATRTNPAFESDAIRAGYRSMSEIKYGQNNILTTGVNANFANWSPSSYPRYHNRSPWHCPSAIDRASARAQDYNTIMPIVDASGFEQGGASQYSPWAPTTISTGSSTGRKQNVLKPRKHEVVGIASDKILMIDVGGDGNASDDVGRWSSGIDENTIGSSYTWRSGGLTWVPQGTSITRRHREGSNAVFLDGHVAFFIRPDYQNSPLWNYYYNQGPNLAWAP